jgi:hypothetical protein
MRAFSDPWNRKTSLDLCFIAFSSCEPGPTSLENALAERKNWLTTEWIAKYAPGLNAIERDWKTLKAHHFAHKTLRTGMI